MTGRLFGLLYLINVNNVSINSYNRTFILENVRYFLLITDIVIKNNWFYYYLCYELCYNLISPEIPSNFL